MDALVEGVGYSIDHLSNPHERIDWTAYVSFMGNVGARLSDAELERCGGSFVKTSRVWRPAQAVARLLFDAREFYIWANTDDVGGGNQLFSCVRSSWEDVAPGHIRIRLAIPPTHLDCREFFVTSKGGLAAMPRVLGFPSAHVEISLEPRAAAYDIRHPLGGGALSWLRRALMWPFTVRTVARELQDAHVVLQQRYQELEGARTTLQIQATQLRTAHRISQIVHGDLDLDHTLSVVQQALVHEAGFAAVEIRLLAQVEDVCVARVSTTGQHTAATPISRDIEIRGRRLGEMLLWPATSTPRSEAEELCNYVVPTIAMALDNALTFTAIADYRANLERKVEERTEELKDARDRLATTVQNLETAQAARDRIFANINHEIRTPLSLILLATRSLDQRDGVKLSSESRERLGHIEQSVQRLLHLVDGLLLLAAGREEKLRLHKKPTDLALLLQQIVALWLPAADEAELSLRYQGPHGSLALVDASAMERAVTNLLSNAVKFTPAGGSIEVVLVDAGNDVRIEVRDTGIGIDVAACDRLFGRFEQDRPAVRPGARGSGIGLSIVKELVDAHGGVVGVDSTREGGATVYLQVPRGLSDAQLDAPATGLAPLQLTPHAMGFGTLVREERVLEPERSEATLLVAEDDPDLRHAIGEALSQRYRVVLAKDGLEALRLSRLHRPDVLITDLGMPGMDGIELTRRFRQLPGNRLAPILMLTAYGGLEDRLSGFDAGAIDYILKPFAPEELVARVHSQLQLRALALKLHESEQLASLGTLSAALAHELRNPANGIVNAIEPLIEALPPSLLEEGTATHQLLEVIRGCAAQIRALARDLLGFARPGSPIESRERVDVIVARAMTIAEQVLSACTVDKQLSYAGDVPCAGHLIVQVLVNLLENAAHAAGPGGSVRVVSRREEGRLLIEVSDSGPGVPVELRHRIFEPFFTTKEPGKGTGLGLYAARKVAEQHGGGLTYESRASGACFQLWLPAEWERSAAEEVGTFLRLVHKP